jgi:hypothetical protein
VGAEYGANIITVIVTIFGDAVDIAIIYYITEFMHPEISIFRNTAVTNVIQVFTVGQ